MFLLRWARDWPAAETRAAERSSERLRSIVQRHIDAVCRTARRLGVPARDLDDVVQDVMLVVVRRLQDIEADKERAFAIGICVRVVANWRRRRRWSRGETTYPIDLLSEGSMDPSQRCGPVPADQLAEQNQQLALLERALAEMTGTQREAFIMFELEELTAKQVAEQLGVSESTVVSRVRRAREVLWKICAFDDVATERAGETP